MRSLSTDLKTWKDSQSRLVPLITLFDIEVNDTTTLRLVQGDPDGTGTITFAGNPYMAAAIKREEHNENVEGDFPSFRLLVSNINGVAGGYIEANELDGRKVTIRSGLLRGTEADYQVETYTITFATYDRKTASITLGPPNFFKRKTNPRKFQRMRCQHSWAKRFADDAGCGYPTDTFEADTSENFKPQSTTNAEQERKFGWYTLNALKCQSTLGLLHIDKLPPGVMDIRTDAEDIEWEPGLLNAPFFYKKLSGDFDVFTEVLPLDTRHGFYAGLLCQSVDVLSSWVYLGTSIDEEGGRYVRGTAAVAGVLNPAIETLTASNPWVRLVRSGSTFTCYYGSDGITWTNLGTQTVPMDADIRLGLCLSAARLETGTVEAGFSTFRVLIGGETACERTREACRLKGNVHRYGAFPGIPTRR